MMHTERTQHHFTPVFTGLNRSSLDVQGSALGVRHAR